MSVTTSTSQKRHGLEFSHSESAPVLLSSLPLSGGGEDTGEVSSTRLGDFEGAPSYSQGLPAIQPMPYDARGLSRASSLGAEADLFPRRPSGEGPPLEGARSAPRLA